MTGTEFADFLQDTSLLCRSSSQTDVSLLLSFAALVRTFYGRCTADSGEIAAYLMYAAKQYGIADEIVHAAKKAWKDRFCDSGDVNEFADRHTISQGRW